MQEFKNDIAQHIPYLRRYARALTGDFQSADRLVQQSLDCVSGLSHLFRDELDSDKKNRLFSVFHLIYNDYNHGRKDLSSWANNESEKLAVEVNDEFEDRYRNDIFYQTFRQLPLQQKQVFLLVTVERFLYEDVSKILNMPLGETMSLLHTARSFIAGKAYPQSTAREVSNSKAVTGEKQEAAEISL